MGATAKSKRDLLASVVLLAALLLVPGARSGSLPIDVVAMFPKDVDEFGYADLREARKQPWFDQLKEQILPQRIRQFEQFLISAGMDPNAQVYETAWALVAPGEGRGEQFVGVALGQYAPATAEEYFKARKLPLLEVRGFKLFAFGSGEGPNDILFTFMDSSTAVYGHRRLVEKVIDVRYGVEEGLLRNEKMFPLINETNGRGTVWLVLNPFYTRVAMRQLVPETAQFPQAERIATRLRALTLAVQADRGVEARFNALCESPEDANLLAAALQAGLLYQRHQATQTNPEMVGMLDAVRVTPRGDRLEIEMGLTEELLLAMIRRNMFVLKM